MFPDCHDEALMSQRRLGQQRDALWICLYCTTAVVSVGNLDAVTVNAENGTLEPLVGPEKATVHERASFSSPRFSFSLAQPFFLARAFPSFLCKPSKKPPAKAVCEPQPNKTQAVVQASAARFH